MACAIVVVFTGGPARQAGDLLGLGSTAGPAWDIAKWPLIMPVVITRLAPRYYSAPNTKQPGLRWSAPGGGLGVFLFLAASVGFAFYVANFDSDNKTYGAMGGVIVFLTWLWTTNIAARVIGHEEALATRAEDRVLGAVRLGVHSVPVSDQNLGRRPDPGRLAGWPADGTPDRSARGC